MPVIILSTSIPTNPKFRGLSHGAFRLWITLLMWSKEHLSDGFLPVETVRKAFPRCGVYVHELTTPVDTHLAPLWHPVEGGYLIHDYADWQDTKDDIQEKRRKWRERQRRSRRESQAESQVESRRESRGDRPLPLRHHVTPGVTGGVTGGSQGGLTSMVLDQTDLRKEGAVENVENCPRCHAPVPAGQRFCGSCLRELLSDRAQTKAEVGRL